MRLPLLKTEWFRRLRPNLNTQNIDNINKERRALAPATGSPFLIYIVYVRGINVALT